MVATVATLFFESPFIGLEKIILGRTSSLEKDKKALATEKEHDSSIKSQHSQKSTSLESENKFDNLNLEQSDNFTNEPQEFRRSSYKHKGFDNTSYQA